MKGLLGGGGPARNIFRDAMVDISQIIMNRDCGDVRISFLSYWGEELGRVLPRFGLRIDNELEEVDFETARCIVVEALSTLDSHARSNLPYHHVEGGGAAR